jgi:hypothetical protein
MKHVRAADLVEFFFEMMKAKYGTGSAGFVGSDAAKRNYVLDPRLFDGAGDCVAYPIRVAKRIIAGRIRWNHHVSRVRLVEGFGERPGVSDIGDKSLGALRCKSFQIGCVSADDANFLPFGKKVGRHYMSGMAACSQYDIHRVISLTYCLSWVGCRKPRPGLVVVAFGQNEDRIIDGL